MSGRKKATSGSELRTTEVSSITSKAQCTRMVTAIKAWMRKESITSVDKLLSKPLQSMWMALAVSKELGTLETEVHRAAARTINELEQMHPLAIAAIDSICAVAMNARKRGELKSEISTPAGRAAVTRKQKAKVVQ